MSSSDQLWIHDPTILFKDDAWLEFVPTNQMTLNQKINAFTRFIIYLSIIALFMCNINRILMIGLTGMALVGLTLARDQLISQEEKEINQLEEKVKESFTCSPVVDENGCRAPTEDNPMMNPLPGDPTRHMPACEVDCRQQHPFIKHNEMTDPFQQKWAEHPFYTLPSTSSVNDRRTFLNWVFKPKGVCKDGDLQYCRPPEELRLPNFEKMKNCPRPYSGDELI